MSLSSLTLLACTVDVDKLRAVERTGWAMADFEHTTLSCSGSRQRPRSRVADLAWQVIGTNVGYLPPLEANQ